MPHCALFRGSYIEDSPLTTEEVVLLGKLAFNLKHLDKSIELLKVAETLAITKNETELLKDIVFTLNTVIKKHDDYFLRNLKNENIRVYAKPLDAKLAKKKKFSKIKHLKRKSNVPLFTRDITERQIIDLFEAACRGDELRTVNNLTLFIPP